jgi:Zn-dependent peptidase ImmA (M78 family)/transcriptional regulator with XRE-family HTH domain
MLNQEFLGGRLRRAREYARMTQSEAAQALGLTPPALNQYEAGRRRVDALTLDRLSRLYAVPLRFFFGADDTREDWEEALRLRAEDLSPQGKAGIGRLIAAIHDLQDLYRRTETPFPGCPHPPFPALDEAVYPIEDIETWADQARRYYDLGMAPLYDVRGFLEAQGYQIFAVPLGCDNADLAGLFFLHPDLGPIVVLNENQAYSRRPFTLAHELAHGLYHHDRPAILCRSEDRRPLERFANNFASFFLIPREALHERLREARWRAAHAPEQVVHLARYFGVSYHAMLWRLREERRVDPGFADGGVKPVALAKTLGYQPSPYEFGEPPRSPEERLPRMFIELGYRAARGGALSERRVAEMLGISDIELEERLAVPTIEEQREPAYV